MQHASLRLSSFVVALLLCLNSATGRAASILVPTASPWTDTGINLVAGQTLSISTDPTNRVIFGFGGATGTRTINADGIGDEGVPPGLNGTGFIGPNGVLPNTITLSLIGKIGGTTAIGTGTPLLEGVLGKGPGFVGTHYVEPVVTSGRLFLGLNDDIFSDNSGSFLTNVTVSSVPEPASLLLISSGLLTLLGYRIWRRALAPVSHPQGRVSLSSKG
jgi:hypothetical protein